MEIQGVEGLRVLSETTFDDFPDKTIECWVKHAIEQYDTVVKENEQLKQQNNRLSVFMRLTADKLEQYPQWEATANTLRRPTKDSLVEVDVLIKLEREKFLSDFVNSFIEANQKVPVPENGYEYNLCMRKSILNLLKNACKIHTPTLK